MNFDYTVVVYAVAAYYGECKVCAEVFAHQVAFRDALENCEAGSLCLFNAGEDSYAFIVMERSQSTAPSDGEDFAY